MICTVLFKLFKWKVLYFGFKFVDNLLKVLTRQQIVAKIQPFHVNELKMIIRMLVKIFNLEKALREFKESF